MAKFVPHTAGEKFAVWLAQNQPEMFVRLLKEAQAKQGGKLEGLTDILSSIGSSIGNAAKSVGSFVTSAEGSSALATLASTYMTTQAQKSALSTQLKLAQLGQSPAPIAFPVPDAQPVIYSSVPVDPVTGIPSASGTGVPAPSPYPTPYTPAVGNQILTDAGMVQLKAYAPWLITAGLFAFLLLRGVR